MKNITHQLATHLIDEISPHSSAPRNFLLRNSHECTDMCRKIGEVFYRSQPFLDTSNKHIFNSLADLFDDFEGRFTERGLRQMITALIALQD